MAAAGHGPLTHARAAGLDACLEGVIRAAPVDRRGLGACANRPAAAGSCALMHERRRRTVAEPLDHDRAGRREAWRSSAPGDAAVHVPHEVAGRPASPRHLRVRRGVDRDRERLGEREASLERRARPLAPGHPPPFVAFGGGVDDVREHRSKVDGRIVGSARSWRWPRSTCSSATRRGGLARLARSETGCRNRTTSAAR